MLGNDFFLVTHNEFVCRLAAHTWNILVLSHSNCVVLQMSMDSLEGLDIGLKALTLRGNKLENLPDLNLFKGLEVVDLQENPLLCDCPLLPLRRLMPFCLNFVAKIFRRITQWNYFCACCFL